MPVVTDDFNRANETPLGADGNWKIGILDTGSWNLVSNAAAPSALGSDCSAWYSGAMWAPDQTVSVKVTVNSTGAGVGPGVCLRRATGARTYYRVVVSHSATNNINIGRYTAGTFASLTSLTTTWVDGDLLTVSAIGPAGATVLTVSQNGVQVGSSFNDTTGTITSGAPGVAYSSTATSASIDDWSASSDDIAMTLPFQAIPFMGGVH